jgi:hypothetical protein
MTTFQLKGRDYAISTTGGPIDLPEDCPELFQTLGYTVAAWGRMEFLLDAILLHINKEKESPILYSPHHPVAFKRKVDLLKAWINKHPAYLQIGTDYGETLPLLKELAISRGESIHGLIEKYDMATGEFTITGLKVLGNDDFVFKTQVSSLKKLQAISYLARTATMMLTQLAEDLFPKESDEQPEKP